MLNPIALAFVFGAELPDLVAVCKSDCPKAKTNEEAHKCAEKMGRLNKSFQKTKCYQENEKYEEMTKEEKKETK